MSPNQGFDWVHVLSRLLPGFESQTGFGLGSSPRTWVQVPI